jgi:hypothetical protein
MLVTGDTVRHDRFETDCNKALGQDRVRLFRITVIIVDGPAIKEKSSIAGRILDRFKAHFGQDNVFMDVDGNNQIVQGDRS